MHLETPDSRQVQASACGFCGLILFSLFGFSSQPELVSLSVDNATYTMPHLLRQNLLLPAPPTVALHDPRTHLRHLPPAYSNAQTPYSRDKDFAPQLRYQLDLPKKPKLRPCKVIFVGDCAVGKTAMVNRCVNCYSLWMARANSYSMWMTSMLISC